MDDNKFWIRCWLIVAITLVSLLAIIAASDWHEDQLRAEIIEKSADPMLAVCAFEANNNTSGSRVPYCTIYLSGRK